MKRLLGIFVLSLLLSTGVLAQMTGLTGTVFDPTGAAVPNAAITVINVKTGAQRATTSDSQGRYALNELRPGTYRLTAKAPGFAEQIVDNIELLVNQPSTVSVTFEKLGATSTTVEVSASATQINTVDATLGNAITSTAIVELPSFARNVANLLSLEPGVAYFGGSDDRNGAVNGGRSDQSNITLDGADVNQQSNRAAFTSVLRVTPDSVEEFRSTTTNAGADVGRGSGANITLVTKSGTNNFHGSLYEYRRGTETAANSFFNNKAGLPIAPLLINIFGGSIGGPIKKNKAFFFVNYEGRRDASSTSVTRTIPTETMKQGIVTFHNAGGQLTQVDPNELKTIIDPLGIGIDPAALSLLQKYPVGNDPALGDGLNTTGYLFIAPQHNKQDTYIAKLDYKIDDAGKHSLFWRGNLQNDHQAGTPQFPGAQPNSVTLANSKGMAMGWTAAFKNNLVSSLRYGFTRQGGETTGILAGSPVTFRGIDPLYGTTTGLARIIPVHTVSEDLDWNHSSHDFKFGAVTRFISNQSTDYSRAYNSATTNASVLNGSGNDLIPSSISVASGDKTTYEYNVAALLGIVTSATGNYNYKTDGTVIPTGSPVFRNFVNREVELYAQDSWRVKTNLTLTYGLRLSIMPPVHEADGQQITTNIPIGTWMDTRGTLASEGLSDQSAGVISYLVAGRPYYPEHNNWAPRLAMAYSPKGDSGLSRFIFGGPGKTAIRAGAGMYYDLVGQPLATFISGNSFGLSTSLSTPPNVYSSSQLPRFTGFYTVPSAPNAPLFLQPAPPAGFPSTYPNSFAITSSLDDQLKAPYTINLDFSIQRELGHGWFVEAAYVGRLSRHNLVERDLAMPTNLRDPKSGQTYFQAMTQLATLIDVQGVSIANLPKIPFFENMWAPAAGNGYTATQVIGLDYTTRSNPGDFTNVLSDMDNGQDCGASGSVFSTSGKLQKTGCGVLGPYSMWSSQYSALNAWSSLGSGAYHAMEWTVSKRLTSNFTFALNYTLSKSLDIGSRSESSGAYSTDFMINSWNAQQLRAVSRYDALHQANAYLVYQLPFGRGKAFGSGMNKILDAFIGGWELTGIWRQTSGLPFSVSDGSRWATDWELSSFATPNGNPIPAIVSAHNAPAISGPGGPNLWADPKAALAAFSETMAGQTGSRDSLRGDGFFDIDTALAKSFTMPYNEHHQLQFRWEAYNVTNTVKFDPQSANLSLTSTAKFGQLSSQLGNPRQMEFALRYTF
ncbi:MAG TPA: carboxypeptidase regulatory-like domain-containing protein [Bryobacteraceae bacterium]|nr:carboxypeptidase regulatory-like domain-containing protein [Bryobacteraceae bacterium]